MLLGLGFVLFGCIVWLGFFGLFRVVGLLSLLLGLVFGLGLVRVRLFGLC